MKTILFAALVFASMLAKAETTDDLKIDCQGVIEVVEVGKAHFFPEKPARGRVNAIPAHGHIEAKVQIQKFQDVQCELLKSKFGFDAFKVYATNIKVSNSTDVQYVESMSKKLLGQQFYFKVEQSFEFVWNGKYLPLYPQIHSERIWLSGENEFFSVHLPIHIGADGNQVSDQIEKWNEEEKTELAFKLVPYQNLAKNYDLSDFNDIFLGLHFEKKENQRKYLLLIWKIFKETSTFSFTRVFDFDVGGDGNFVGSPFAQKFIALANELASTDEKLEIIFQFPSILRPSIVSSECLRVSANELNQVLQKWIDQYESLSSFQQSHVEKVLNHWGQPWSQCLETLKSPENDHLVQEILQKKSQ